MRRFIKKFKNSIIGKILSAILKLLLCCAEIIIIFLAIIVLVPRFTNNESTFLGYRIFNVATGSMEPEYAVGDILISKEKDPSLIEVGDNIVYLGKQGGYNGKIITHNVIQIEQNEKGEYLFHTKGRANTVEDPIVHEDQLYGTIVHNNRILAFVCRIVTNRYGLYFLVVIPIIISVFINFVKAQEEKAEQEREQRRINRQKRKAREEQQVEGLPEKKSRKSKVKQAEEIKEADLAEKNEEAEEQVNESTKKAKTTSKVAQNKKTTTKKTTSEKTKTQTSSKQTTAKSTKKKQSNDE